MAHRFVEKKEYRMKYLGRGSWLFVCCIILPMLGACSESSTLVEALEQKVAGPRNTASLDVTETVTNFVPTGTAEKEAIAILSAAGFHESFRNLKRNRFATSPVNSDYYIGFTNRITTVPIISNHEYTVLIGVQNGSVNQVHSSVRFYTLGIN